MLSREWDFPSPEYPDGNWALRHYFEDYLRYRGLPRPQTWYPLRYGALTDQRVTLGEVM
jgi:hypothetical protein